MYVDVNGKITEVPLFENPFKKKKPKKENSKEKPKEDPNAAERWKRMDDVIKHRRERAEKEGCATIRDFAEKILNFKVGKDVYCVRELGIKKDALSNCKFSCIHKFYYKNEICENCWDSPLTYCNVRDYLCSGKRCFDYSSKFFDKAVECCNYCPSNKESCHGDVAVTLKNRRNASSKSSKPDIPFKAVPKGDLL